MAFLPPFTAKSLSQPSVSSHTPPLRAHPHRRPPPHLSLVPLVRPRRRSAVTQVHGLLRRERQSRTRNGSYLRLGDYAWSHWASYEVLAECMFRTCSEPVSPALSERRPGFPQREGGKWRSTIKMAFCIDTLHIKDSRCGTVEREFLFPPRRKCDHKISVSRPHSSASPTQASLSVGPI